MRDNYDAAMLGLMCVIELEAGEDWSDLEAYATGVLRDGVRGDDHQAAGLGAFTLAVLAMARGRYRDAERWAAEADGHFARQDAFGTVLSVRAIEVGIGLFTGDPARAREALAAVYAILGEGQPMPTQTAYLARAEGWGARALSEPAGADAFMAAAGAADQPNLAARLFYEALRAGAAARPVATELDRLARRCDARLVAAYAAQAEALAARDGAALLAAAEEMAAIGADAYAMEAAVSAARQFVSEARLDSARRAAARARELHASAQGAEFPLIDGLDAVAIELTRREAQIAALATRGLSNQEIADQLTLSVRTVETYVYRAMQKRGVSHRQEL
jgi:ATP/maltotriose-dependent transcriptional regulator MalT